MSTYVLVSSKSWHDSLFDSIQNHIPGAWHRITEKFLFTKEYLEEIKPEYVFIPHWSYLIPETVYKNFQCVVFHMTDLPYGRGGSPLQNLILRNHKDTMVSAIKVSEEIDAGDIYLKMPLSLEGSAKLIFERSSTVIEEMICSIVKNKIAPKKQIGTPIFFKRRKPSESNIELVQELETLYNYIRMLDCDGYPTAFLETLHFRMEFSEAILNNDNTISANVRIIQK